MMTKDQEEAVKTVFRKFSGDEEHRGWTEVDDDLSYLGYLTDEEIVIETEVQLNKHSEGKPRCTETHGPGSKCLVPVIIDAASAIVELYQQSKQIHSKNRYVLEYYLAFSHLGLIVI